MRTLRPLVPLTGLLLLAVLAPLVHRSSETTYGGADHRLLYLQVAAACALLTVSVLGVPRAATLTAFVGATWLVPELAGATEVPLVARTVADAFSALLPGLTLMAAALRAPQIARMRGPVVVTIAGGCVAAVARLFLVDPFLEVDCWRTCDHNPLLIGGGTLGGTVELVGLLVMSTGGLWAALELAAGTVRARADVPRSAEAAAPVLLAVTLVAGSWARADSGAWATTTHARETFVVAQLAGLAWLAATVWTQWRRRRLARRLVRDVDLLRTRTDPATLTRSLRAAARDPNLDIAYWAPARETFVDADGRQVSDHPAPRVTTVTRHGQPIARLQHSSHVDGAELERALGPTMRLVLENEQLRAAALAELDELRSSRTRVVERAALERRRLERNLHDGAQQRAVSLSLLVRMLVGFDGRDVGTLHRAETLAKALVDELRRVARGIYPAVLVDTGLRGAVLDLAERSGDLPVLIGDLPAERYAGAVDTTAYLVVRASIADARAREASQLSVRGENGAGVLRLCVEDDGRPNGADTTADLTDQVTALGGWLDVDEGPDGRRIEVSLPCVSS